MEKASKMDEVLTTILDPAVREYLQLLGKQYDEEFRYLRQDLNNARKHLASREKPTILLHHPSSKEIEIRSCMTLREALILDRGGDADSPDTDALMDKIRAGVIESWKTLPLEVIFEALTSIGDAPSLLYDDNGKFAVLSDGTQELYSADHGGFRCTWVGDKTNWKPSVREAVGDYIERLKGG